MQWPSHLWLQRLRSLRALIWVGGSGQQGGTRSLSGSKGDRVGRDGGRVVSTVKDGAGKEQGKVPGKRAPGVECAVLVGALIKGSKQLRSLGGMHEGERAWGFN